MRTSEALPQIIQGGMGVAVSNWRLANAVSRAGQLGVVSGTGVDTVLVRRLQDGDPGGHVRRAMARFPIPGVAEEILRRYFRADGRPGDAPYAIHKSRVRGSIVRCLTSAPRLGNGYVVNRFAVGS